MTGENRPLVTDEPVEFEKFNHLKSKTSFAELTTDCFREIYGKYIDLIDVKSKRSQLVELGMFY